jgi:hypothetical protein
MNPFYERREGPAPLGLRPPSRSPPTGGEGGNPTLTSPSGRQLHMATQLLRSIAACEVASKSVAPGTPAQSAAS